jgi:signal transduction histidine kinase/CheY-like chemotaxis protein
MAGNSDPEFGHLSSLELLTAIQRAASGSLTFQRNASDHNPFNRRAYLAGHSLAHSGVRVIFYQPAASATKEAERCQMLATFWVIVAALASGAFASWFGRRVVSPVLDLRDYLDGVNISSDSAPPIPRRPDVAAEMLPLWTGIRRLQGRTNQAIQQAQEAADAALAATRQKTEFLATISHEIRTPLNCILGMLPRVREEALSRGQQDALALVERSGQHLLSILNDVLDFSRIEQGQLVLRNDPVETVATCEEALEMLVPAATRKGLELTWIVSPDIPAVVRGDALRLKQILLNLVGNAVKFTERGSIEIDLGWESKPGPALYGAIILRVRDTGPGIGPDRIERLFQPFWQLNEPVGTPPNTGAGLGLSIIKRLLDKMGGEIRMESALGSGTLVSVSVPVEVVACGTAPPGQSVVVAGSAGRVRESLVSQLNFLGCTVEASDGVRFAPASGRWLLLDERLAHAQERENSGYLRSLTDSGWRVAIYQSRLLRPEPPLATLRLAGVRCLPAPPSVRNLRALFEETLDTMSNPLESNADCPSTMNPLRILVAEDNAENRLVIDLMLRRLGYCPSIVNDGIAAWDAIQATEFDLAMLDLRMPGIDGLSLARRIRETMPSPPRLVALTASAFDSDRKLCLDAGFSEFLSKPIQEATLLSVLSGAPRVNGPSTEEPDIWCGKNLTSFLQICGERADGMIQSILDDVSNWLTSPLDETPPAQVADRAHKLAGSAFLIGATALAQSLKAIEAAAPTGPAPLAKAVGSAAAIFDSTRKQFPELRITTALQVAAAVPADS